MPHAHERRRSPVRRPAELLVGSPEDPRLFGRTRNVSVTGVFLETDARTPLGATRDIAIAWGARLLECRARIVRHAEDGLALDFIAPDSLFTEALQHMVDAPADEPG